MLTMRLPKLHGLTVLVLSAVTLMTSLSEAGRTSRVPAPVPRPECPLGGNWELFFLEWHGDSVAYDNDVPSN